MAAEKETVELNPLTALSVIADRLEAWSEAHHACAMKMSESEDVRAQMNLRDNYRTLANFARAAIAKARP